MTQRRLILVAGIVGVGVLVSFLLSAPRRARDGEPVVAPAEAAVVPTVGIRDSYKKGTHTITAELTAPNACTTASAEASVTGDPATAITVAISLVGSEGVCLELPTKLTLKTSVDAAADLPITATVNGATATTTAL